MAKNSRKLYYWDVCAFIAWLNGGQGHAKEVIAGLDEIAKEITENRAVLCTSVTTYTEILEGKLTPEQIVRLQNLFKRKNVTAINIDSRIAQMASEIRNYYNQRGINIKTPDAQHLASAIIYKADEFDTLDGDGDRQRPSDLLRLNGNVAGHPLHIRVPTAMQGSLLAGVGPMEMDAPKTGGEGGNKEKKDIEPSAAEIQGSGIGHSKSEATEKKSPDNQKEKEGKIEGPPSL